MKRTTDLIRISMLALTAVLAAGTRSHSSPDGSNRYFINAAEAAKRSVVNIVIYQKSGKRLRQVAFGSGTVVRSGGCIVTNHHVVEKGNYYHIISSEGVRYSPRRMPDGGYYQADRKTDIALMVAEGADDEKLKPIEFEDSNGISEGEWVIAVGNPYGLNQSITSGIVSSKGRDNIGFTDIEDFIQTDTPINPGNSGGPLVSLRGKLVGINTAIRSSSGGFQGISFAIPSNIVRQVTSDLIEFGRVRRGWLGFLVRETEGDGHGKALLEVISVSKNSPAEAAGIKKGDMVREIDGNRVPTLGSLIKCVAGKPVGSKVRITISRGGRLDDISMVLREKKSYLTMKRSAADLLESYGIGLEENSGGGEAVVSNVSPSGYGLGLKRGDIILTLNGKKTPTIEDFFRVLERSENRIRIISVKRDSGIYEIKFHEARWREE